MNLNFSRSSETRDRLRRVGHKIEQHLRQLSGMCEDLGPALRKVQLELNPVQSNLILRNLYGSANDLIDIDDLCFVTICAGQPENVLDNFDASPGFLPNLLDAGWIGRCAFLKQQLGKS